MKKGLLFSLFVVLAGQIVFSQEKEANVQLQIHLADFQSISLNESQKQVDVNFETVEDFIGGKTAGQANHLEISSTSQYEIKVSASSELEGETASIPVNTVSLIPSFGDVGAAGSEIEFRDVALSTGAQTLVDSGSGDSRRSFNIDYKISGGQEYMNKPEGSYKTTITYSILPN